MTVAMIFALVSFGCYVVSVSVLLLLLRSTRRLVTMERNRAEVAEFDVTAITYQRDAAEVRGALALEAAETSRGSYSKLWSAFTGERNGRLWALRMLASTAAAGSAVATENGDRDNADRFGSISGEALSQVMQLEQQSTDAGIDITDPDDGADEDDET